MLRFAELLFFAALLVLPWTVGCSPAIPEEELGTIHNDVPVVPGADQPYEMPELEEPDDDASPQPTAESQELSSEAPSTFGAGTKPDQPEGGSGGT